MSDIGALLTAAGLVTATAVAVAVSLATSLWTPLLMLQMNEGIRPRWSDIAWAQIIAAALLWGGIFLALSWHELGALWTLGIVVFAAIALAALVVWLDLWGRTKATPPRERMNYARVFFLCVVGSVMLIPTVDLLIRLTGGASVLTADQRGFTFLALHFVVILLISGLSKIKPSSSFMVILTVVIVALFAGSIGTAQLPKMLATSAGIRLKDTADLIISKETCARAQMLAKAEAQERKEDWKGRECVESGALLRAEVQVHSGGRWLLLARTLDGVEMPSTMTRFTAPDAAIELVLPAQNPRHE
ncbi:hypothetical protein ASC78_03950 [Variovorax sp. Root318D1]|nr:hypothetical protein ASC78_03950 [Variovorax sp. Root318D1]